MAFDFPASPTVGQVFSAPSGPTYVWDGTAWTAASETIPVTITSSSTAQRYNRIINPQMNFGQMWTADNTADGYFIDQWGVWRTTSAGVITRAWVGVPGGYSPKGAPLCLRVTITTADTSLAATETLVIGQGLEGTRMHDLMWGTAAAQQLVVRFSFKAPAGTYAVAMTNNDATRCYRKSFTISAGQANAWTEQTLTIPGDTTVAATKWTEANTLWGYFYVTLAAGTTYQGTNATWDVGPFKVGVTGMTNGMGTAARVYEITDVGIYADPAATGLAPPWEPTPYDRDFAECRRYYEVMPTVGIQWWGYTASGTTYGATGYLEVAKRTTGAAISGTSFNAVRFPAAIGTLGMYADRLIHETRIANATGDGSLWQSTIVCDARM